MRFLVDAQLPPALAQWLKARGHDAQHVRELGLEAKPDRLVLAQTVKTGAVIVTKDADFSNALVMAADCQVVWLRQGNATSASLLRGLDPVFAEIEKALAEGQKLVEVWDA